MTDSALPIAVSIIAGFEGFRSTPYLPDAGSDWTIGFGFTYLADGTKVTADTPPITEAEAKERLTALVSTVLERVRSLVHVQITDNQAAALASLGFNIGTSELARSTLMRDLNAGNVQAAATQFMAYINDCGEPSDGLRARRAAERELFLTGVDTSSPESADELNAEELNGTLNLDDEES